LWPWRWAEKNKKRGGTRFDFLAVAFLRPFLWKGKASSEHEKKKKKNHRPHLALTPDFRKKGRKKKRKTFPISLNNKKRGEGGGARATPFFFDKPEREGDKRSVTGVGVAERGGGKKGGEETFLSLFWTKGYEKKKGFNEGRSSRR